MSLKRLPAFTILEITVALLISAIAISITYTVYLSFSKSYRSYVKKHEDMATVLTLDKVLRTDFDRADLVRRDSDGIVMQYKDQTVRYTFDTAFVLRTVLTVRTDTFPVKSDSVAMFFENQAVNELSEEAEGNRIDQLDLSFFLGKEKIPYFYRKVYSSADLIHRKSHAVH